MHGPVLVCVLVLGFCTNFVIRLDKRIGYCQQNSNDMKKLIIKCESTTHSSISCHLAEDSPRKLHDVGIQPDGLKSYVVCLTAALCNVIVIGYCYSFGVLFPPLLNYFSEDKASTGTRK